MASGALLYRDGKVESLPMVAKSDLSERVFDAVSALLGKSRT
jgi:hypothetical protein